MAKISSKYLDLIKSFPLRPIHNEQELHQAETVLRHLLHAKSLSAPEQDYLLLLGNVIEEYEAKVHPVEPLPRHEMLAELIDVKGVTQTEVAHATKIPVSTISELLSKKRDFNVAHIEKLCAYFGLGPSAFIHVKSEAR